MILSMSNQFYIFLLSILIGIIVGLLYDMFRIIRKLFVHSNLLIQIEDILFWLIATIIMFYFVTVKNSGEIRGFLIGGLALGMILYFLTASPVVLKASMAIILILTQVVIKVYTIVAYPIKVLIKILSVPCSFVVNRFKIYKTKSKKVLQKSGRYVKMKRRKTISDLKIIFRKI